MISLKFLLEHTSTLDDVINYCLDKYDDNGEIVIQNDLDGGIGIEYHLDEFIMCYDNFKKTYNLLTYGSTKNISAN